MKNKEIDCCTEKKIHEEVVDKTKKEMPDEDISRLIRLIQGVWRYNQSENNICTILQ